MSRRAKFSQVFTILPFELSCSCLRFRGELFMVEKRMQAAVHYALAPGSVELREATLFHAGKIDGTGRSTR